MADLSRFMTLVGKADEFKYPMITALLVALRKANAPTGALVIGGILWLALAVVTRIGTANEWPAGLKDWVFVLTPVLFSGFLIYAAVEWGVSVPED